MKCLSLAYHFRLMGVSNLSVHVLLCVCACSSYTTCITVPYYVYVRSKPTIWGGVVRPFSEPLRFACYVVLAQPDKLGALPALNLSHLFYKQTSV